MIELLSNKGASGESGTSFDNSSLLSSSESSTRTLPRETARDSVRRKIREDDGLLSTVRVGDDVRYWRKRVEREEE
jgi:hypothetical protein